MKCMKNKGNKWLAILGAILLAWPGFSLAQTTNAKPAAPTTNNLPVNFWFTNAIEVSPGPDDSKILKWTSQILVRTHYRQQAFNDEVSSQFLDRYLDALDQQHLLFLQSDLDEFEPFRKQLDDATMVLGDPKPALTIFNRFLKRIDQQVAFVHDLLQTNKFEFNSDERYNFNRRQAPRPKNLDEAKQCWRDRLYFEYLQEKLNDTKPAEIVNIITRRYARIQRYLKEFDSGDVLEVYLTALAHVYDPHSDYMGKSQMDKFNIDMKLSLFGIGCLLGSEDGYCKVIELLPGGPAAASKKIKTNDRIVAVAQGTNEPVDIIDMKLNKAVDLIRGAKGTEVRLTIIPADAADSSTRKVISLMRDEIKLEQREAKAKIIEFPGPDSMRIGVIDLPSFYAEFPTAEKNTNLKSTTADVARLLKKLEKENVRGIILDLRNNGGGALDEAINLTGLFIKDGPVVLSKDSSGTITESDDPDPSIMYDGPLVVLTSRFSASASEILAGALQDYDRAVIVGDSSTYGKGTVQQLLQLEPIFRSFGVKTQYNPGALKITIRKYYRASGSSTQLKGVVPDVILPSANEHTDLAESAAPNALPWDTIPTAKYLPFSMVKPYLTELNKRSAARLAADPDLTYLRDEIERYQKSAADKSVSLNEEQRRKEKKENADRQKARKEEIKKRPEPMFKAYELTLKEVDLPGLPPPLAKTNTVAKAVDESAPKAAVDDEEKTEEETPVVDIQLSEAKRVLLDLISLYQNKPKVAELVQWVR
jgi:carboxyl-terminal processing protease